MNYSMTLTPIVLVIIICILLVSCFTSTTTAQASTPTSSYQQQLVDTLRGSFLLAPTSSSSSSSSGSTASNSGAAVYQGFHPRSITLNKSLSVSFNSANITDISALVGGSLKFFCELKWPVNSSIRVNGTAMSYDKTTTGKSTVVICPFATSFSNPVLAHVTLYAVSNTQQQYEITSSPISALPLLPANVDVSSENRDTSTPTEANITLFQGAGNLSVTMNIASSTKYSTPLRCIYVSEPEILLYATTTTNRLIHRVPANCTESDIVHSSAITDERLKSDSDVVSLKLTFIPRDSDSMTFLRDPTDAAVRDTIKTTTTGSSIFSVSLRASAGLAPVKVGVLEARPVMSVDDSDIIKAAWSQTHCNITIAALTAQQVPARLNRLALNSPDCRKITFSFSNDNQQPGREVLSCLLGYENSSSVAASTATPAALKSSVQLYYNSVPFGSRIERDNDDWSSAAFAGTVSVTIIGCSVGFARRSVALAGAVTVAIIGLIIGFYFFL